MFLRLMEFFVVFVLAWFIITQVCWPFIRGTSFFPFFKRERKLDDKLADINQSKVEKDVEKTIKKRS